ncbi:hypothetical protein [Falsiroseomonas sp. E2-1-a20]|uniref:hypothetical protein n=1 Tax=Falsiroseomonas sp. E2-1-a20 TaxID=3239300 RepID=UPI003F3E7CFE
MNRHQRLWLAALIFVLSGLLIFVAARLVRVENQRYALLTGMCRSSLDVRLPDLRCLRTVETRTSWGWHLYYGLTD